ncbi:hypothetical protein Patl1_14670 [Pistacia atlantica]|uniref:Uncharacterized protein n=1 Tax=Pistacia atlantica TaxID=434234 RepID=A0ACC1AU77_9ROSI|nr:hypothetical protein Patl1_14670 [Pistacia atlantica]
MITEVQVEVAGGYSDPGAGSFSGFQRRIEFHPARKVFSGLSNGGDNGDFKLETLNPSGSEQKKAGTGQGQGPSGGSGKKVDGSEFWDCGLDPELSFGMTFRRIFDLVLLKGNWYVTGSEIPGAGLENLGNTCFLNSVLQCLTYTEPLAAYLQSGKHRNSCRISGFCALCAIQKHVSRALQAPGRILAPKDLVLNLRCISRNFRSSRQEDAHEYMVNLLESMHKCCLPSGVPSESPSAYEKSLVHKIFGGRLRSQVKCMQCSYCSNKFDPFLDLSLEIHKADSVHKALTNFTAAELLDGGEKQYQCQRCKQKVRALKQLTVHKAPYVLTVHLKRFRSHDPGQKIDKKVQFGPTLDMKPFVSGSYEGDLKYTLYGVLIHHGWSTHSGHYYCFIRTSSGMWYSLDDNRVVQVNERSVLEQKAYMLFYVRDRRNVAPKKPIDVLQKDDLKANVNGNKPSLILSQQSKEHLQSSRIENGVCGADSSSVKQKNAVNGGLSKEAHLKEASSQPGRIPMQSSVPKKEPMLETSSSAPLQKDPSVGLPFPNLGQGKSLQPSASSLNSNGGIPYIENNTIIATKEKANSKNNLGVSVTVSSNCNGHQNSASNKILTTETSQKINGVSNAGASINTPSRDSSDKSLERVSNMAQSGGSSDKMLEKADPIKSAKEPSCEKTQAGNKLCDSVAGTPAEENVGDNGQTTLSVMENEPLHAKAPDCASQRKLKKKKLLKCRINSMPIGLKFFKTSLGLRKKKKHKRSKRCTVDLQNLSKELLLDKDSCLSSDLGPSTSEKFGASSRISQKKVPNGTAKKNGKMCNGDSLMNGVDGKLTERICQNGAVLATDERLQKRSDLTLEVNRQDATEPGGSKDSKKDVLQDRMSTLTRGLEEATLASWDGIELHPPTVESADTRSLSIGYVLDEWDEEYDRGKRKKLRNQKHSFGEPNPFQEIATKKTQFKKAKLSHTSSGDRPFRI